LFSAFFGHFPQAVVATLYAIGTQKSIAFLWFFSFPDGVTESVKHTILHLAPLKNALMIWDNRIGVRALYYPLPFQINHLWKNKLPDLFFFVTCSNEK